MDEDGAVVVASASLRSQQLPIEAAVLHAVLAGQIIQTVANLGQGRVIQLATPLIDSTTIVGMLQVAQPLQGIEQTLSILLTGLVVTTLQALLNLVANAIQHTPPGGSVTITLAQDERRVTLIVRDSGPGIAPEDLPYVFERFYRGDRAKRTTGAGLGLAIVRWVAGAHGGHATVTSRPGEGTTFTIVLPRGKESS